LQTGVSFPISYSRARITGEELRLEMPHWGRFSGFVSYANQSGPITDGLFIVSDAQGLPTDSSKFAASQKTNEIRCGGRFVFPPLRACGLLSLHSMAAGCPRILENPTNVPSLIAQFGEQVMSRVNLERRRVDRNFSLDFATEAELYRKELRSLRFQFEAANVTDGVKVINFDSLFSGTAVGRPRVISARLRLTF
jgi:hypothetical protein